MKLRLLPSSFESDGSASVKQHLTCFIVNGSVAFDAGSLAMGISDEERAAVRDVILSHAHLDHIAGLPLFLDDLFANLTEPVRIHASASVIQVLERDVFNWSVYPKFSDLQNANGRVLEYIEFTNGNSFEVAGVTVEPLEVNHKVPSSGFVISDRGSRIVLTGDTSSMGEFWQKIGEIDRLDALLIECAFPNQLSELAEMSHHLTPRGLSYELERFSRPDCKVYVINIKPAYRNTVVSEIGALGIPNVEVLEAGRLYEW